MARKGPDRPNGGPSPLAHMPDYSGCFGISGFLRCPRSATSSAFAFAFVSPSFSAPVEPPSPHGPGTAEPALGVARPPAVWGAGGRQVAGRLPRRSAAGSLRSVPAVDRPVSKGMTLPGGDGHALGVGTVVEAAHAAHRGRRDPLGRQPGGCGRAPRRRRLRSAQGSGEGGPSPSLHGDRHVVGSAGALGQAREPPEHDRVFAVDSSAAMRPVHSRLRPVQDDRQREGGSRRRPGLV